MSDLEQRLAALEAEVATLRETRAIEALRYTYWYAIADKDVDALVSCFDDNAHLEYGFGIELEGTKAIHEFFTMLLGAEDLHKQIPRGANPQITVLSDTEAEGRWMVEVGTTRTGQDNGTRVSVQYFEKYKKHADGWKIAHMKNDYFFFETIDLQDSPA